MNVGSHIDIAASTYSRTKRARLACAMVVACLCLASFPGAAFAQEDVAKMQKLAEQATMAFQDGRFSDAAELFIEANKAKEEPVLLKNAMVAYYSAKNCDSAVQTAFDYIGAQNARGTDGASDSEKLQITKDLKDAKTVISKCRLQAAEEAIDNKDIPTAKKRLEGLQNYVSEGEDVDKLLELRNRIKEEENRSNVVDPDPDPDPDPDKKDKISDRALVGWVLLGSGVVFGGATGGYTISTNRKASELDGTPEGVDFVDNVKRHNKLAPFLYGTAGALVVTGVTLLILDERKNTKAPDAETSLRDRIIVAPELAPNRAGATMLLRF